MKKFLRAATASGVVAATLAGGLAFGPAAIAAPAPDSDRGNSINDYLVGKPGPLFYLNAGSVTQSKFGFSTKSERYNTTCQPSNGGVSWWGSEYIIAQVGKQPTNKDYIAKSSSFQSSLTWNPSVDWPSNWTPGTTKTVYVRVMGEAGGGCAGQAHYGPTSSVDITRPAPPPPVYYFTANRSYTATDDSFTVSGTTVNGGSRIEVSADGTEWTHLGNASGRNYSFSVPRSLTSGATLKVREGSSGSGKTVTLRTGAVQELEVAKGQKRLLSGKSNNNAKIHVSPTELASDEYQSFTAPSNGSFKDIDLADVPQQVREVYVWQGDDGVRTKLELPLLLGATAKDVDVLKGTATLDGFAPAGATDVDITWNGKTKIVEPDAEGAWSHGLTDLAIGKNTVQLKAWKGGEPLGEYTLEVDLDVAPLEANATFSEVLTDDVTISGTGQVGATIMVRHGEAVVAQTDVRDGGEWDLPIGAPYTAGNVDLTVTQQVRGEEHGMQDITVDYGRGIEVTSPVGDIVTDEGKLNLRGNAQKGVPVKVFEKGREAEGPLATTDSTDPTNDSDTGTYSLRLTGLKDREYTLTIVQYTKGGNEISTEVVVNEGQTDVALPAGTVTFDADVAKEATISGTGAVGGKIAITDAEGVVLGRADVDDDGDWKTTITSPGAGTQTLTLTQTGVEGTQTGTTTADFGAAVTVTGPTGPFQGSTTPVTGTGAEGATIVITEGDTVIGQGTVENGSWNVDVADVQDGQHTYTVTQTAQGATTTTADITVTRDALVVDVTVTAPTTGSSYAPEKPLRFEGRGTPGATITISMPGLTSVTTTVQPDGSWHLDRNMWHGRYVFTVTQTAKGDHTSTVTGIEVLEEGTVVDRPFAVTAPASGSEHRGELVEFTGTGTPDSTITLHATNITSPDVTTTVDKNGYWSVKRWIGDGPYSFDVIQTSTENTETGRLSDLRINQSADVVRDFAVTTPTDGSEHRGELVEFTGDGTPMSTITLHTSNFTSTDVTTTVDKNGHWSLERWIGNGPYTVDITQTTNGDPNGTTTLHLNAPTAPVVNDFAVTSPEDGAEHRGEMVEFTGDGAAGSTITLHTTNITTGDVTTTVKDDGHWSVKRWIGDGPYAFDITQTTNGDPDGTTTVHLNAPTH